ncbi:MAG TPA: glycosyltransferase, partial [Desulfosporosinus sp.]|nr:glycosyltransferase [Desulfosporosinus sp.]
VVIVCDRGGSFKSKEARNGVQVYRTGTGVTNIVKRVKSSLEPKKEEDKNLEVTIRSSNLKDRLGFTINFLNRKVWHNFCWPDAECIWFPSARRMVFSLIRRNEYDGIISVSHPFSDHLVGFAIKRLRPGLRWLVDLGDPFSYVEQNATNNQWLYRRLNYMAEQRIFHRAEAITVTTPETQRKYVDLFPGANGKIHVIPPVISWDGDLSKGPAPIQEDNRIVLVYAGTLYRNIRGPDFLLRLCVGLFKTKLGARLELHIFGNISDVEECFKSYPAFLGKKIFIHGLVSHDVARQAIQEANILVNIGNETSYQLPSKVVEYASTGKPVLNLAGNKDDTSAAFFRAYPAALCLVQGEETLSQQVERLKSFIQAPPRIPRHKLLEWIKPYTLDAVTEAYLDLLR